MFYFFSVGKEKEPALSYGTEAEEEGKITYYIFIFKISIFVFKVIFKSNNK